MLSAVWYIKYCDSFIQSSFLNTHIDGIESEQTTAIFERGRFGGRHIGIIFQRPEVLQHTLVDVGHFTQCLGSNCPMNGFRGDCLDLS